MRANEKDAFLVGRSDTDGAVAMVLRRRYGKAGQEVGVPVGTSFAIFQSVVVRSEEFQPLLYPQVVFCDLVEAFKRLVVQKNRKFAPIR